VTDVYILRVVVEQFVDLLNEYYYYYYYYVNMGLGSLSVMGHGYMNTKSSFEFYNQSLEYYKNKSVTPLLLTLRFSTIHFVAKIERFILHNLSILLFTDITTLGKLSCSTCLCHH